MNQITFIDRTDDMDLGARMELGELRNDVRESKQSAEKLVETVRDLNKRVQVQSTLLKVVIGLLIEKTDVTEAELVQRTEIIAANHSVHAPTPLCTACDRPLSRQRQKCVYCGAERPLQSVVELL